MRLVVTQGSAVYEIPKVIKFRESERRKVVAKDGDSGRDCGFNV